MWAFDTGGNFRREYTVDEEQVENFREYEKIYGEFLAHWNIMEFP